MEVEVALTFLYMLGEALPASHGNHFSGDPVIFLYRYISVQLYLFTLLLFRDCDRQKLRLCSP